MVSKEASEIRATLQKEVVNFSKTLEVERREWEAYAANLPLAREVATQIEIVGNVKCLRITPDACVVDHVILFAHGGGLVTGSILTHRAFASEISAALNRKVLLVEYSLIPENNSVTPRNDFAFVYQALLADGRILPTKTAFMGDSNGAGVCVAALVHLRDLNMDLPACAVSISGAFYATLSGESMSTRDELDPVLSRDVLSHWQACFDGIAALDAPEISPLFADIHDLPPLLLLVGDHEVWLSDSVRMANKFQHQGLNSEIIVFDDMWHVWMTHTELPETKQAFAKISAFVETHFTR